MSQVTIAINGCRYRLVCEDGEEERIVQLADYIDQQIHLLKQGSNASGHDRLLIMAALMVTDQLWDAKRDLRAMKVQLDQVGSPQIAENLHAIADRVEALKERLIEDEAEGDVENEEHPHNESIFSWPHSRRY